MTFRTDERANCGKKNEIFQPLLCQFMFARRHAMHRNERLGYLISKLRGVSTASRVWEEHASYKMADRLFDQFRAVILKPQDY